MEEAEASVNQEIVLYDGRTPMPNNLLFGIGMMVPSAFQCVVDPPMDWPIQHKQMPIVINTDS